MALIGTISGSNGTSTTAISGSLVIADAPLSSFPKLTGGVKFLVSGSKNANRTDDPQFLFNVDVFHSGAIGSDQYMQFKPVSSLQIPSNTTASYIYTSGSTNDMYFTQYQPGTGFTNTTRLRWLEGQISTGLFSGGVLSTANGSTTFSVTSGSGIVVTINASTSSESYPVLTYVNWPAYVSSSLPGITTNEITYIAIDSTGSLFKQNVAFGSSDYQDKIILGRVLHQTGSVTNGTITQPTVAYGQTEFRADFIRIFGPIKVSGHVLSVNATPTVVGPPAQYLGLAKTAGDSYAEGRNYLANPNSPNYVKSSTDTALSTSKIFREYIDNAGKTIIDTGVGTAGYTAIDPTQYNNAGVLTLVGSGNKFTIQRVYWFPNSVNRALFVYYGNAVYSTIAEAEAAITSESFTEGDNTRDAAILVGYIIVRGTTVDLNVTTDAKIIQAAAFRFLGEGGTGGATIPGGSDTYVQFNDNTSFGGNSNFRFDKSTGTVSAASLNVTGSGIVVTGSGVIESNTSTSALRITQQGSGNAITVEDSANPDSTPFVVAADGKVGIGVTTPTANLFVSGTDSLLPAFVAKGSDATVNTLSVTSSVGASTAIGFVNIDQGNYSNKYALTINNIGVGTAGLKLSANSTGGSFAIDNMNTTPQITMTHKNLWFNSVSTAFDTSQVTYKFIENNKGATYPNQKTFLISGNTNGHKTGSYFEVEKSGSTGPIKILELQGDTTDNALFVSGTILTTGSIFINNDLAVNGGDITTTAATFNLITGSAATVNFAQSATSLSIGGLATTSSVAGDLTMGGRATLATTVEKVLPSVGGTGTVNFDTSQLGIFYVNGPAGDILANFTNVPTTNNRILTPTVILSQSATPRIVSGVQVNSVSASILWANNVTPSGTANKQDVFGFSLIRSGSIWTVLGQMSTYG